MTDSLTSVRRRRLAGLLAASALLAGLVAFSVLRPDPEEKEYQRLKGVILAEERPDADTRKRERQRDQELV